MKKIIVFNFGRILLLLGIIMMFYSCEYNNIVDANYPGQLIYMPGAKNGIFVIDQVIEPVVNPTPGALFRFTLDQTNKKFVVPLSVYRSGIDNKGNIEVRIRTDEDTIAKLKTISGMLPDNTLLLPANSYTFTPTVVIKDGDEIAKFNLSIDFDFLRANHGKSYAIGVNISSDDRKINKSLSTMIIVINTSFLIPVIDFTPTPDITNGKTINFINHTLYGTGYSWDFGDGAAVSTDISPIHTYASYGTYTVRFAATGLIGNSSIERTIKLWENLTNTYFPNPGNPFLRSDSRAAKTGNLKDWSFTPNVQTGGYGGFYLETGGGVMDFYSGSGLTNAKIYRTIDLPAGEYKTGFINAGFTGTNNCYFAIALGNQIPDIETIETSNNVLGKFHWNTNISSATNEVSFKLDSPQTVTIGFVVSNTAKSEIKINSVFLLR